MAESSISSDLRRALNKVHGLPEQDVESIKVLISAGEWGIALETLCTQIDEYDVETSKVTREELLRLGELLDVPSGYLLGDQER